MGTAAKIYRSVSRELMRDELIVQHLDFVRHILARHVASLPDNVDQENLECAGILGLVEAAQQFDPSRNVTFRTFAYPRIRGAIIDELRRNCPLPQRLLQMIATIRQAVETMEPPVTPELIAEQTGLTPKQVDACLAAMRLTRFAVWDDVTRATPLCGTKNEDRPESRLERDEMKRILSECIQCLPDQERIVLTMYYLDELRQKEIGKVVGLSETRISRILAKAELRLRELVRSRTN